MHLSEDDDLEEWLKSAHDVKCVWSHLEDHQVADAVWTLLAAVLLLALPNDDIIL